MLFLKIKIDFFFIFLYTYGMNFTIKTLSLYKDLWYTTEKNVDVIKTEYLWKYRCGNKNNEFNPKKELYLLEGQFLGESLKVAPTENAKNCSAIKQGKYLFLQGLIVDKDANNQDLLLNASEELYLESLWLESKIIGDVVYIRFLEEDGKNVFQIFREVEST